MKKFTLLFLFSVYLTLFGNSQLRTHLFAGPQMTTASYKVGGKSQDASFKPGFMAGIGLKVPFDNQLYFAPTVFYSLKGYKVTLSDPAGLPDMMAINNEVTVHSVELGFMLHLDLSKSANHLFLRAGPSLDFALTGREKFDKNNGDKVNRPMKFGFGDYGHYLASGLVHLGYETPAYYIMAQYQGTLGSISNLDDGPVIKHRILGLTAGFFLK